VFSFPHVSLSNPVRTYTISIRATRRTHPIFLDLITRLTIRDQQTLLSSWLCSFFIPCYLVALGLKCLPQHSFSWTNSAYTNIFIKRILCTSTYITNHTLISVPIRLGIYGLRMWGFLSTVIFFSIHLMSYFMSDMEWILTFVNSPLWYLTLKVWMLKLTF